MSHTAAQPIPRADQLYANPGAALAQEEVRIAPAGKRALVVGIIVLGLLAPLLIRYKMGLVLWVHTHAVIMAAILVVGLLLVALCPFGVELVLTAEGLWIRRRATAVYCPWALFNAPGNHFGRQNELVLPIASRAIPFIRQYRHEWVVGQGVQVRTALLRLQKGTQAVLLNQSQAPSPELGPLLLHLGRSLGGRLPAESAPAEACPADDGSECRSEAAEQGGWVSLSLTRVVFPPRCCDCGQAFDTWLQLDLGLYFLWVVACLGHYNERVRLSIPICRDCLGAALRRQRRRQWAGAATGIVLGLLTAFALGAWRAVPGLMIVSLIAVVTCFIGFWIGLEVGRAWARFPVRGYYSPATNTVVLRFRQPDYAAAVRAVAGQRAETLPSPARHT